MLEFNLCRNDRASIFLSLAEIVEWMRPILIGWLYEEHLG